MIDLITRDNLRIEHSTGHWGGPIAWVTVNTGPLAGRIFTLKSTEGLTEPDGKTTDLRNGGGIHVDSGDGEGSRVDWRGVFRTLDMDEAVDSLVEYVNELAERKAVERATWVVVTEAAEALTSFRDSLEESSRREWRQEWQRVCDAFVAARLKVAEFDKAVD